LEKLYFENKDSKNALEQLRRDNLVEVVSRALKNNQSYYHLTSSGAKAIGASTSLAAAPGGAALSRDLKILYFCAMASAPRERVPEAELRTLFEPDEPPTGEHCLARRGDSLVLFRVYVPTTDPASALRQIRDLIRGAREIPNLADWLGADMYSLAVLAPSNMYAADLLTKLQRSEDGQPALTSQIQILVESPQAPVP
jgi:hypothetical protein